APAHVCPRVFSQPGATGTTSAMYRSDTSLRCEHCTARIRFGATRGGLSQRLLVARGAEIFRRGPRFVVLLALGASIAPSPAPYVESFSEYRTPTSCRARARAAQYVVHRLRQSMGRVGTPQR